MTLTGSSAFHSGGGAMGARLRAFDWNAHPLGPIEGWSPALRIAVDALMASDFASCLFWGPDLLAIYNDGYRAILADKPDALGEPLRVTWSEAWDGLKPICEKALAGASTFIEDFPLTIDRHGYLEQAYFTFCYSPVFDERGNVMGLLDTVVETTDKVLSDQRAQADRLRQQHLLQHMPGFVAVTSGPDHVYTYTNDAFGALVGDRKVIGLPARQALPELDKQGRFARLDHVYRTGEPFSGQALPLSLTGRDTPLYVDLLYEPTRDAQGRIDGVFIGGYDVTERRQAEASLIASEARLRELNADLERQVVERTLSRGRTWLVSPELLGVVNAKGFFEASNPAWTTMLGWSETEVTHTPLLDFVHPDDQQRSREAWDNALHHGLPALNFENRLRVKGGGWRWLSWVAVPEEGRIYCSARDIQYEKDHASALAAAQEALRQSQKMEAVGQLTGGIAHDFNNLLGAIGTSLQVLQKRLDAGRTDGAARYIDMAQSSVRRAAALTQRLLAFSRRQTLDPRPTDVRRLIGDMEPLIRQTMGPSIRFEATSADDLWPTRIDGAQLENALLNLCINARDAMAPAGGDLTIQASNCVLGAPQAAGHELPPGDYLRLCVTDTGTGMSADTMAHAFEPFFTTKPTGQGTGLGLSMVYGFVRQSGGQLEIASTVGAGTTLCFFLPRHHGLLDAETVPAGLAESVAGDGEVVLLIEDEIALRTLLAEELRDAGYRVLVTATGPEGLRLLQSPARIDLLLTDVGLPGGLNGRQVADAARVGRPELRVLFITGYAESAAIGNGLLEAGMGVITKPFDIAMLTARVHSMIERTGHTAADKT